MLIIISDAAYRGGKIGNNISLRINGDFVLTVAVIPDDVIDTILRSEKVEISFGYIGNSLEIWSIRVEDTLECGGEVLVGLPSYCNFSLKETLPSDTVTSVKNRGKSVHPHPVLRAGPKKAKNMPTRIWRNWQTRRGISYRDISEKLGEKRGPFLLRSGIAFGSAG